MLLVGCMTLSDLDVPTVDGFDHPLGAPDGVGYYDAQPFGHNDHLGADLNGVGGGATDLGDPVYAIANGRVVLAEDLGGGWGKVVILRHALADQSEITSLYAHLDELSVSLGDAVDRGDALGTVGDADGVYIPHLHFEIRTDTSIGAGGGYSEDAEGWVDPMVFIRENRPEG